MENHDVTLEGKEIHICVVPEKKTQTPPTFRKNNIYPDDLPALEDIPTTTTTTASLPTVEPEVDSITTINNDMDMNKRDLACYKEFVQECMDDNNKKVDPLNFYLVSYKHLCIAVAASELTALKYVREIKRSPNLMVEIQPATSTFIPDFDDVNLSVSRMEGELESAIVYCMLLRQPPFYIESGDTPAWWDKLIRDALDTKRSACLESIVTGIQHLKPSAVAPVGPISRKQNDIKVISVCVKNDDDERKQETDIALELYKCLENCTSAFRFHCQDNASYSAIVNQVLSRYLDETGTLRIHNFNTELVRWNVLVLSVITPNNNPTMKIKDNAVLRFDPICLSEKDVINLVREPCRHNANLVAFNKYMEQFDSNLSIYQDLPIVYRYLESIGHSLVCSKETTLPSTAGSTINIDDQPIQFTLLWQNEALFRRWIETRVIPSVKYDWKLVETDNSYDTLYNDGTGKTTFSLQRKTPRYKIEFDPDAVNELERAVLSLSKSDSLQIVIQPQDAPKARSWAIQYVDSFPESKVQIRMEYYWLVGPNPDKPFSFEVSYPPECKASVCFFT